MSGLQHRVDENKRAQGAGDARCADGSERGWPARLALTIGKTGRRGTRLLNSRHCGPLCVQKAFYPEGPSLPHFYLLHPPGGIVTGDRLDIELNLEAGSMALFTTPGAARVYRARADDNGLQSQQVRLRLAERACAEWLPGETILYPGARGRGTTRVELALGSRLMGWEINCIGLPASGRPFDAGVVTQRFEVFRAGRPLFIDSLHLDTAGADVRNGGAGLAGRTVSALFVSGPFAPADDAGALVERLRNIGAPNDALLGVTLVNGFIAVRYLGDCAWQAREWFVRCWRLLRPAVLDRAACPPRIWAT
jgi:urease accessory protein